MSILTRKIHSTHLFFSVYRIKIFTLLNFEKVFVRFGATRSISVACDEGNFSFPEECCLQPFV